jgi:hypothetical protein
MRPYFASFLFFASSPFFYLFSIIRLDVPLKAHPLLSTYPHPVKDRLAHIRATEVMKASNLPCPNTGNNLKFLSKLLREESGSWIGSYCYSPGFP